MVALRSALQEEKGSNTANFKNLHRTGALIRVLLDSSFSSKGLVMPMRGL